MTAILCALISAALLFASQGPSDLWFLAWIAPTPMLWLAYGEVSNRTLNRASIAATLLGQSYYFLISRGAFLTLPVLISVPLVISLFALQAIAYPFAIRFARAIQRRHAPLLTLFAFPLCWTAFEFLISLISPHASYGAFAYSQMSAPMLVQSAAWFGMYAVTFLICLFANALALALRGGKGAALAAATGFAVCALNAAAGLLILAKPQGETIRVAAMSDVKAEALAFRADTLQAAMGVSTEYANTMRSVPGARFIVLPEGGIVTRRAWRAAVFAPLITASRQSGAQIVAGVMERAPWGDLALAFNPDGTVVSYAKRHPMPLMEAQFAPGAEDGLIGQNRAMAICKDLDFPRSIRAEAENGVRLIGVPAGDVVYDAWIHARLAIMRGVENGFAVVRAGGQGLLTISDAQGRLIASKTAETRAGMSVIVADVAPGPGPTLYTRTGDVFAWLCVALTVVLAGAVRRGGRG